MCPLASLPYAAAPMCQCGGLEKAPAWGAGSVRHTGQWQSSTPARSLVRRVAGEGRIASRGVEGDMERLLKCPWFPAAAAPSYFTVNLLSKFLCSYEA